MSRPRTVWSFGLLICLTNAAFGDVAPTRSPLPKPPMVAPVKVVEGKVDELHPNAVAKIVIPSSLIPDLQEAAHAAQISNDFPLAPTTFAGLVLSAVAISLMFAFKSNSQGKWVVVGLIGCVMLAAIVLLANFFFPSRPIAPQAGQSKPQSQIVIEVQKDGHEVLLVLPANRT